MPSTMYVSVACLVIQTVDAVVRGKIHHLDTDKFPMFSCS